MTSHSRIAVLMVHPSHTALPAPVIQPLKLVSKIGHSLLTLCFLISDEAAHLLIDSLAIYLLRVAQFLLPIYLMAYFDSSFW
jgi:hypothetical protein